MTQEITLEQLDELMPTAVDFRRTGRYQTPLIKVDGKFTQYGRSSSAGKLLDDDANLVDWAKCVIVLGAAQRPDLMAQASTMSIKQNRQELREMAEQCLVAGKGQQRAVTGTAVHRMLDLVDSDAEWTPAPQFQDTINAYVAVRDAYGLVPVDIEVQCVNDTFRLAGTMDRRYRATKILQPPDGSVIEVGEHIGADTKTGSSLDYAAGAYATQLAAYVDSVRYDPQTDERTEFDPPTFKQWGLIFHLDHEHSTCEVHWVDLDAGRAGLQLAHQVRQWRKRSDLIQPARAPLHKVPGDSVDPDTTPDPITLSKGHTEATSPDLLEDVRSWLLDRATAIRDAGAGPVFMLQRLWPAGVSGLGNPHTESELDAIASAISAVETECSLSFPATDPRVVASDRWAKPDQSEPSHEMDDALRYALARHPRRALLERWSALGQAGGMDPSITDRMALTHALYEFARIDDTWSDEDLTEMLDGTLRAMGYMGGVDDLGCVPPNDAPLIMASAFSITAGTAMLLINEQGKPIVRTIVK